MKSKPVRLRYSRKRGAHLVSPNLLPVVGVDRRTKWGNPFGWEHYGKSTAVRDFSALANGTGSIAEHMKPYPSKEEIVKALRGRNLACWCQPGEPCHADILLEIANR